MPSANGIKARSIDISRLSAAFVLLLLAAVAMGAASTYGPQIGEMTRLQQVVLAAVVLGGLIIGYSGLVLFLLGILRSGHPSGTSGSALGFGDSEGEAIMLLRSINDRLLVSDSARRITYRQEERRALHGAIREDIDAGHYDTAMMLATRMSHEYGYREEAEAFRDEILAARAAETHEKISQAISNLDQILARYEWENAAKEAARVQRLFPDSPLVKSLSAKVVQAREQRKRDLEREFLRAAGRDDVDHALKLIKELDKYLTPEEAEPFRETARGVIGKQRDNLGVQFKLAIQDKDWVQAVRVGEQIIREFPNSKMADEVRDMLDLLRERAAGQQAAQS